MLLGPIGSRARKDYTVIGDAVNTAARVEALTKEYPETVLATGAVVARLSPELAALARPLGTVQVKGKSSAVEVYGIPDGEDRPV